MIREIREIVNRTTFFGVFLVMLYILFFYGTIISLYLYYKELVDLPLIWITIIAIANATIIFLVLIRLIVAFFNPNTSKVLNTVYGMLASFIITFVLWLVPIYLNQDKESSCTAYNLSKKKFERVDCRYLDSIHPELGTRVYKINREFLIAEKEGFRKLNVHKDTEFFSADNGKAMVFYSQTSNCVYNFYNMELYDPKTGEQLKPVNPDIIHQYFLCLADNRVKDSTEKALAFLKTDKINDAKRVSQSRLKYFSFIDSGNVLLLIRNKRKKRKEINFLVFLKGDHLPHNFYGEAQVNGDKFTDELFGELYQNTELYRALELGETSNYFILGEIDTFRNEIKELPSNVSLMCEISLCLVDLKSYSSLENITYSQTYVVPRVNPGIAFKWFAKDFRKVYQDKIINKIEIK